MSFKDLPSLTWLFRTICVVKNFTLPRMTSGLCPQLLLDNLCLWVLACQIVAMWFVVKAFYHLVSVELAVRSTIWAINQSCQCREASVKTLKTLYTRVWVSFCGWQHSVCIMTSWAGELMNSDSLHAEKAMKALYTLNIFSYSALSTSSFSGLYLYLFLWINYNYEYSFQWVLGVL